MAGKFKIAELKVEKHNEVESWKRFKNRFEIAALTVDFGAKVVEDDAEKKAAEISKRKAATLVCNLGETGMAIFETFNIKVEELRYDDIVTKFENYFEGRENKTMLRHRFLNSKQQPGEELTTFIQRISALATSSKLGDLEDDLIVHVIINGVSDEKLKSAILQMEVLNLEKAKEKCTQFETAERTMGTLRGNEEEEVGAVGGVPIQSPKCHACGQQGHFANRCPNVTCYECGAKGHISRDCHQGQQKGDIVCYSCGGTGHISRHCPQGDNQSGRGRGENRGRGGYRGRGFRGRGRGRGSVNSMVKEGEVQKEMNVEEHMAGILLDSSDESL